MPLRRWGRWATSAAIRESAAASARGSDPASAIASSSQIRRSRSPPRQDSIASAARLESAAQDPALQPVDRGRARPGGAAQERDHLGGGSLPARDREQGEHRRSGGRAGERDPRLRRDRDAEPGEHAREQRRLAVGAAHGDGDVVGIGAVGEQAGDPAADQLGLAAVPGALEQLQRAVGPPQRRIGLEQVPLEVVEKLSPWIRRSPRERLVRRPSELVDEDAAELRARLERRPLLLEGDRDGHVGGARRALRRARPAGASGRRTRRGGRGGRASGSGRRGARRSRARPRRTRRRGRARPGAPRRCGRARRARARSRRRRAARRRPSATAASRPAACRSESSVSSAGAKPSRAAERRSCLRGARSAAARASQTRCIRVIRSPPEVPVARPTSSNSPGRLITPPPSRAPEPRRQSSRSSRSTSSRVGATSSGSRSIAASKSSSRLPSRPEPGGPEITLRDIPARSLPRTSQSSP